MATFDWPREDKRPENALGKACDMIRRLIRDKGMSPLRLQQRQDILESNLLANDKQIKETKIKVEEQQVFINKLVETSMSLSAFRHLAGIYLLREYYYWHNEKVGEVFKRELYFLKDRGFIEPERQEFYEGLNGRNLVELVWPTEIGKTYINLRKADIPMDWLSADPQKRRNLKIDVARDLRLHFPDEETLSSS